MIFISRYKNFSIVLRPTIRRVVHSASGSEEVIIHNGVVVEFKNAMFDTKSWREFERPSSPDNINVIKSEQDLIRLMKQSPYFNTDFFEREKGPSREDQRTKLLTELAKLEAEESAENPDQAPIVSHTQPEVIVSGQKDDVPVIPVTAGKRKTSKTASKKQNSKKKTSKSSSKIDI